MKQVFKHTGPTALMFAVLLVTSGMASWCSAQKTTIQATDGDELLEYGQTKLFRHYPEFRRGTDPYDNLSGTIQENVDTYSGKLSLRLALPPIPWSATTAFSLPLSYTSNIWSFQENNRPRIRGGELDLLEASLSKGTTTDILSFPDFFGNDAFTRFSLTGDPHCLPGWTLAVGGVYTEFMTGTDPIGLAGEYLSDCYRTRMEKKFFVTPDGNSHLLVDTKTANRPYWGLQSDPSGNDETLLTTPACTFTCDTVGVPTQTRTLYSPAREAGGLGQRQWHSVDGSFFLYDEATKAVYSPDGTVYALNDHGVVCAITDPEGNTITFRMDWDESERLNFLEYANRNQTSVRIYYEERSLSHYINAIPSPIRIRVPVKVVAPGVNGPVTWRFETQDLVALVQTNGSRVIQWKDLFYSCVVPIGDQGVPVNYGEDEAFSLDPPLPPPSGTGVNHQVTVLTAIVLPDGRAFRFQYSLTGRVVRIIYPDGGSRRYEYGDILPNSFQVKDGGNSALWKAKRAGDSAWGGVCLVWQEDGNGGSRVERAYGYSGYSGTDTQPVHSLVADSKGGVSEFDYSGVNDDSGNPILQYGLSDWRLGRLLAERHLAVMPSSWTADRLNAFRGVCSGVPCPQNYVSLRSRELGSTARLIRESSSEWDNHGEGWYWTAPSAYQCNNGDSDLPHYYDFLHGPERPEWNPVIVHQVSRIWEGGSTPVEQVTSRLYDDVPGPDGEWEYHASLREETVTGGGTGHRTTHLVRHYWPRLAGTAVKRRMLNLPEETAVFDLSGNRVSMSGVEYTWSDSSQVSSLADLQPRVKKGWIEGSRFATETFGYESSGQGIRLCSHRILEGGQVVLTTTFGYDSIGFCTRMEGTPAQGSTLWQLEERHAGTGLLLRRSDTNGDRNGNRVIDSGDDYLEYAYDACNRPQSVTLHGPAGESMNGENQGSLLLTDTTYAPYGERYWVQTRTWRDSSHWLLSRVENDALGRPAQLWKTLGEEAGQVAVSFTTRTYTVSGQVETETLPAKALASASSLSGAYPSWPSPAAPGTITHSYDPEGRETETATDAGDGMGPSIARVTFGVSSGMAGACLVTTRTDEAGHWRQIYQDALGRTVQVEEPSPSGGSPWITLYSYDAEDHLTQVDKRDAYGQPGQIRSFAYDGLGRLVLATVPELAGRSLACRYDDRGNMLERYLCTGGGTAADYREVQTWDGWSRPILCQVYMGAGWTNTITTSWTYDTYSTLPPGFPGGSYTLGREVRDTTTTGVAGSPSATVTRLFAYNWRGELRQKTEELDTAGVFHTLYPDYDRMGTLTRTIYPSGEEVVFSFGQGGGLRSALLRGEVLFDGITFSAHGAPEHINLGGTGNWCGRYDARGRPLAFRAGPGVSAQTPVSDPSLVFGLDFTGYLRDGNLTGLVRTARLQPGSTARTLSCSYGYDELDRLLTFSFSEASRSGSYRYDMDEFGNLLAEVPVAMAGAVPDGRSLSVDRSTNRLQSAPGAEAAYDALGNQIRFSDGQGLAGNGTFLDSGHLGKLEKGGIIWRYYLDADGRRRISARGPSGLTDVRLSFFQGEDLIAELYRGAPDTSDATQDGYMLTDHLGTTRAILDASGSLASLIDSMPYGEPLASTAVPTPFFTGKPRDAESGLDAFGARHYDSLLGRWLSPDEITTTIPATDPQRWNLYLYCAANPVNRFDPDGKLDFTLASWYLQLRHLFYNRIAPIHTIRISPAPLPSPPPASALPKEGKGSIAQSRIKLKAVHHKAGQLYKHKGKITYCNIATRYITQEMGGDLRPLIQANGQAALANKQAANLALSPSYMQVSPEGAADFAALGIVVLAVQPTQTVHGHIATVSPESIGPVTANGRPTKILFNHIGKNTVEDASFAETFASSPEVKYYVQKGP